jgi:hypothetical protein
MNYAAIDETKDRAAFESWARDLAINTERGDYGYRRMSTRNMWSVWQAALLYAFRAPEAA